MDYELATMELVPNPYHKGFKWQVNYGNSGRQWFKDKHVAKHAMDEWNNTIKEMRNM